MWCWLTRDLILNKNILSMRWIWQSKFAIHVARLTIHEVDVRNSNNFSDKLVEDWR